MAEPATLARRSFKAARRPSAPRVDQGFYGSSVGMSRRGVPARALTPLSKSEAPADALGHELRFLSHIRSGTGWDTNSDSRAAYGLSHQVEDRLLSLKQTVRHPL